MHIECCKIICLNDKVYLYISENYLGIFHISEKPKKFFYIVSKKICCCWCNVPTSVMAILQMNLKAFFERNRQNVTRILRKFSTNCFQNTINLLIYSYLEFQNINNIFEIIYNLFITKKR